MKQKILVTSALPYVNNVPHLGNIIGCVLSADVFARYMRGRGNEVLYVCGTDEHGTATETKALEEGLTPQQICDKYHKIHSDIYRWFGCSFDIFGRTSTDVHTEVTQSIFKRLLSNGLIAKDSLDQLYCPKCDKFLADRFVGGTCPKCGYEQARGDQCESCGNLLNATELLNPRCKVCASKPTVRSSDHLFLDLPALGPELKKWTESASENGAWTQNAKTVTEAWFKEGLKPRCITRDLRWGVQVPLEGYTDKVFYVWFDAPIGYISITKKDRKDWADWWQKPSDVKLYQFMAKDNIPFHTILFPATLLGTKESWTLLHHIDSTEYLNYENGKFSKSAGTGVFGDDAMDSGITADVWRYYLLANRPEGADTQFSWSDFQEKNNNELLANLGNFVNRTLTFVARYFSSKIPKQSLTPKEDALMNEVNARIKTYIELMDSVKEKDALRELMMISRLGNQYFQENAPWTLVKPEAGEAGIARCSTVINVCCNLVRTLAVLAEPFLPSTAREIYSQLNAKPTSQPAIEYKMRLDIPAGTKINEPKTLFRKIEDAEAKQLRERFSGKQKKEGAAAGRTEEVAKLDKFPADLRVGVVENAEDHPEAGKLYVLRVDLGTEKRQLVAGIKPYIAREQLVGKHIIVVCNLKHAKLRGIESQGMLLAAEAQNKLALLEAPASDAGDEVVVEGVETEEDFRELDIDRFFQIQLETESDGTVLCRNFGRKLKTPVEYVKAKGLGAGAKIR